MKLSHNLSLKFLFCHFLFGSLFLSAQNSNDNPKWISPKATDKVAYRNQSMEIGFYLKGNIQKQIDEFSKNIESGLNPYDSESINFSAVFTSPSGKKHNQFGFYYANFSEDLAKNVFEKKKEDYPWRLRFAPDEIGEWKMNALINGKSITKNYQFQMTFNCQASTHKGPLTTLKSGTEADRYLTYSQTGESFNSIGINLSNWGAFSYRPEDNRHHMKAVQKHADQGGNFTRFEMGAQNGLPDWQDMRNYNEKQDEMFAYDRLLQKAEDNKMYYIIFRHHVEIVGPDWGVSNWNNNPYRKALGIEKLSDYYTNPESIKWHKNNIRYMYSRWGYSPYWSFYGYSELEQFYKGIMEQDGISEEKAMKIVLDWYLDQKKYILDELKPNEMFSNSYGRLSKLESKSNYNGFFKNSDVVSLHIYSTIKSANFVKRYESVVDYWNNYHKPIIIEEMGINDDKLPLLCCTKIEFHNSIWSTAFMGDVGTGLDWWYDRGIFDFDYNMDMKVLADFLKNENFVKEKYYPQKWSDGKDNKRKIESYQLINEKKDKIIGWLHNATYYWRNEAVVNTCLQGLIDSSNLENPCTVAEDMVMGRNESPRDYNRDYHLDKYTSKGGFQPIRSNRGLEYNPTFKVENVNFSRGKNKHWYRVEFYSTQRERPIEPIHHAKQIVRANFFKDLVINVPNLDDMNPDVAFKITYLGRSKNSSNFTP
jgi:hypothetical protein